MNSSATMNMNANFAAMAGQMAAMQQAQTTAQYDAFYHTQLGTMFDKKHFALQILNFKTIPFGIWFMS